MKKTFYLIPVCILLTIGFVSCVKDPDPDITKTPAVYTPFCKYEFTMGSDLLNYADIDVYITPFDTTKAVIMERLSPSGSSILMKKEFSGSFLPTFSKIEVKASLKPGVDTVGKKIPIDVSFNYTASLINSEDGKSSNFASHNSSMGITIPGFLLAKQLKLLESTLSCLFRFDSKGVPSIE